MTLPESLDFVTTHGEACFTAAGILVTGVAKLYLVVREQLAKCHDPKPPEPPTPSPAPGHPPKRRRAAAAPRPKPTPPARPRAPRPASRRPKDRS